MPSGIFGATLLMRPAHTLYPGYVDEVYSNVIALSRAAVDNSGASFGQAGGTTYPTPAAGPSGPIKGPQRARLSMCRRISITLERGCRPECSPWQLAGGKAIRDGLARFGTGIDSPASLVVSL